MVYWAMAYWVMAVAAVACRIAATWFGDIS
jgi:hypothetical protein